jgi:hypothetical protein
LDEGYVVYVDDVESITRQLTDLSDRYGDRIKFGKPPENIKVLAINL